MEVQILSRETIKPSTREIPHNHDEPKVFKLSALDNLSPEVYTPITFFYSTVNETDDDPTTIRTAVVARLKTSLSQTLARYHILAGRIKGDMIQCYDNDDDNDTGALFVEAKVLNMTMNEFLKKPNLDLISQFLPILPFLHQPLHTAFQIAAQINTFSCGGIAIGLCFLHKIIDGTTMSSFIKSWAHDSFFNDSKSDDDELVFGNYDMVSSLFPPQTTETWDSFYALSSETPYLVSQGKNTTVRRFVFDAMAISNLKGEAKSISVPNPTTVEVVTCFIWKYAMKAAARSGSSDKERDIVNSKFGSTLVHLVNIRGRIQPPLMEHDVGNIYWSSRAYYEASNTNIINLDELEIKLRKSLVEIDNDFIQTTIGEDGVETILSSFEELYELYGKSYESFMFSSWRNMGLNEVNFGWGKPIWICNGGNVFASKVRNVVVLMDTISGDGMEAWILLDDETMNILENDQEFLEFASLNPSIQLS